MEDAAAGRSGPFLEIDAERGPHAQAGEREADEVADRRRVGGRGAKARGDLSLQPVGQVAALDAQLDAIGDAQGQPGGVEQARRQLDAAREVPAPSVQGLLHHERHAAVTHDGHHVAVAAPREPPQQAPQGFARRMVTWTTS